MKSSRKRWPTWTTSGDGIFVYDEQGPNAGKSVKLDGEARGYIGRLAQSYRQGRGRVIGSYGPPPPGDVPPPPLPGHGRTMCPPPEVARAPWNEPTPGRATAVVRGELPLPIGTDPAPRAEEDDAPAFAGPGQDASSSSRDAAKESLARELAVERLQERLGSSRPLTAPATSPA